MRVKGTLQQLSTIAEKFLDEASPSACLNIESIVSGKGQPAGFVQILFVKPQSGSRCPKCGVRQYSDSIFCHRCGTRLELRNAATKPEGLEVNFRYTHSAEPLELLGSVGIHYPAAELVRWDKQLAATIMIPVLNAQQITELATRLLFDVQGLPSKSHVVVSIDYGY